MRPEDSQPLPDLVGTLGDPPTYHVLLVDADPEAAGDMKIFLEETPGAFDVALAHSDDEAFLKLVEFKPDIIVLDAKLLDRNGIEILNPIQDMHPNAQILILTQDASPKQQQEMAKHLGAVRFVEKPTEYQGFGRLLQELGAKSRIRAINSLEGDMDILDLVQMMYFCHVSTAVRFVYERRRGTLRFERGEAIYIDDGAHTGENAFYNMALLWGEGRFYRLAEEAIPALEQNNWTPTDKLLVEAAILRDHSHPTGSMPVISIPEGELPSSDAKAVDAIPCEVPSTPSDNPTPDPSEIRKARLKTALAELMEVDGALAAMLVDASGYVIEGRVRGRTLKMDKVAAVLSANLGSTQALGREWSMGCGQLVMLEFEKGTLLARMLGERGVVAVLVEFGANLGHHRCQLLKVAPEIEINMP